VRLKSHARVLRWRLAPQLVDEPIVRDDLVRPQQEDREDSSLFSAAEVEDVLPVPDLERPKDAEVECQAANVSRQTSRSTCREKRLSVDCQPAAGRL